MEMIDNITKTIKDDLKATIQPKSKVSIAAACFSIYAYQELKKELEKIDEVKFIFTSPTFIKEKIPKEKREFYIPRLNREKSLYGTEFEVRLRNELSVSSETLRSVKLVHPSNTLGNMFDTLAGIVNCFNEVQI